MPVSYKEHYRFFIVNIFCYKEACSNPAYPAAAVSDTNGKDSVHKKFGY